MTVETLTTAVAQYPLDPLSADEIEAAAAILRRHVEPDGALRFCTVTLHEPPKDRVLAFEPGDTIDREVYLVVRDMARRVTYEAIVSVTDGEVRSFETRTDVQPTLTVTELIQCEEAIRRNPEWQAAMARRGYTTYELAQIDPWPLGYHGPQDDPAQGRQIYGLTWVRMRPEDNGYARPIEGLIVRFDLDRMEVMEVEDHGVVPIPPADGNYTPDAIMNPRNFPYYPEGLRGDLKPLEIVEPDGPSFEVNGSEVRWQKWRFRVGFSYREGLVLYQIGYEDKGRLRPVIYRASVTEMFIPYGDANPTHWRKNVFDMGEFGLGIWTNSLVLGCDCLGEIRYFDAVINDDNGNAVSIKNAICMHEEDYGILWKHTDFRTLAVEVRRNRRLVVSSIVTVGNYEYGFYWYFYQDGSIEFEVKLSGIISDGAVAPGERPMYGRVVAPGVYGPNHQHYFCVRLDMTVDGVQNSVYESNAEAIPWGPENPHGNAWVTKRTLLASESEGQRIINPLSARYWVVTNPNVSNALGEPVGYRLIPGETVLPLTQPEGNAIQRAVFATRNLWVTAYHPKERFPAGDFVNQSRGGDGMPQYVADDEPLENTDVVVWYSFGSQHVPRPEDWPVMPVAHIGFKLKPDGFFDGNPGLDVPPSPHCKHEQNGH